MNLPPYGFDVDHVVKIRSGLSITVLEKKVIFFEHAIIIIKIQNLPCKMWSPFFHTFLFRILQRRTLTPRHHFIFISRNNCVRVKNG